jgi:hypothetical protein
MLTTQVIAARLTQLIINPLIGLIFTGGLLVFFWGAIQFLVALNAGGSSSKEDGKKHMFWGLVGMFVMVASWALFKFLVDVVCGGPGSCYANTTLY